MNQFTPIGSRRKGIKLSLLVLALVIVLLLVTGVWWFTNRHTNNSVSQNINTVTITNTSTVNTASFKTLAKQASCAQTKNELYVIDNKMVVWLRQGNCPDNGYTYTLYARNPQEPLCTSKDSIAGASTSCVDDSYAGLFDTIIGNLGDVRLGLDVGHTLEKLVY